MLSNYGVAARRLPELILIDDIENLCEAYKERYGQYPINVSHWDPSSEFGDTLKERVPSSGFTDPVPYRYSYLLERMPAILQKLGFSARKVKGLVTENGTTCIAAVANWLMLTEIQEVFLLSPYYFTTPYNLQRLGIDVREVILSRNKEYSLPPDLRIGNGQALWLTNPIYSTGVYSLESQVRQLGDLLDSGAVIVADEALALTPSRIGQGLGGHRNFVGIYTPHKSICVNGLKFSAIVTHPSHRDAFEDWADVLSGGLSLSAMAAVEHFLTPAFDDYRITFLGLIQQTKRWHDHLLGSYRGRIETDSLAQGHFLTAYVPHLDARLGNNVTFLGRIMEETGCALMPGTRSSFDASRGFCFRVNLAQDSLRFRSALNRLYEFLSAE